MLYNIFRSSGLLVLTFVAFANAKCETKTVESDFQKCFAEFSNLFVSSKGTFHVAKLESYCQSKAQTEIRCAQKLIEECRNSGGSKTRRIIDNVLSVDQVERSLDIVCNNTAALEANQTCIRRYKGGVDACVSKEEASFDSKSPATYNEKEGYRLICEYWEGIKVCFRPFSENCGRKVGDILNVVVDGMIPPVCSGGKRTTAIIHITTLISVTFLMAVKVIL